MSLEKRYNPRIIESKWAKKWEREGTYKFNPKSRKPVYSIDTPPPYLSGYLHVGHAMHYTQFEYMARYYRMKGYNVFFPFGSDDNGLPTERHVEKKYKINKNTVTRKEFTKLCQKEIKILQEVYKNLFSELGYSFDWSLTYSTIDKRATKTAQLSFLDLYKKGLVERRKGPTLWCPHCQTALAQAEIESQEEKTKLNYIHFELRDGEKIEIATTRPELLHACTAVFVNPDDKRYKKYVGKTAKTPLFKKTVKIMPDKMVDKEYGSGIVMVCTFGDKTDIEWYYKHKLNLIEGLDKQGRLINAGKYNGLSIKKAREKITRNLKERRLLVKQEDLEHEVGLCWRCSTPVEFLITKQWYINLLNHKDEFINQGRKVKWHPEYYIKRYENWVAGLKWDWCISRQRYYGTQMPIWYCKKCGKEILPEPEELPVYPINEKPKRTCDCGSKETIPEEDVFDTWMTSSLTPFINAYWAYGKKLYNKLIPMSLRPQAHDIIRTWAFYTIVKTWYHEKEIPWNNIMMSGHGLDAKGKKMSKSKGNIIQPKEVIQKYGADALRFWASTATLGEELSYREEDVIKGSKFINKLWNAARFISTHEIKGKEEKINASDKWILNKLYDIIKKATKYMDKYEISKGRKTIANFFWHEFCDYYLEMIKYRIYDNNNPTRNNAIRTARNVLENVLKLMAPFTPFATEEIWRELYNPEKSIHLESWPEKGKVSKELEELGDLMKEMISQGRQYKISKRLSQGAELKKAVITGPKELKKVKDIIKGTLRIKDLELKEGKLSAKFTS